MSERRARSLAVLLATVIALVVGSAARSRATQAPPVIDTSLDSKDALDRQTPRRTLAGFLREAKEGDFRVAADYLDLRALPASSRDAQGPALAQKLSYVLERQPTLDLSKVPDVPEGDPDRQAS